MFPFALSLSCHLAAPASLALYSGTFYVVAKKDLQNPDKQLTRKLVTYCLDCHWTPLLHCMLPLVATIKTDHRRHVLGEAGKGPAEMCFSDTKVKAILGRGNFYASLATSKTDYHLNV